MIKEKSNEWKAAKPMVWIKTEDGNTWICPKDAISDRNNVSPDELATASTSRSTPRTTEE